jgi:cation diffusion facilitator family transporter
MTVPLNTRNDGQHCSGMQRWERFISSMGNQNKAGKKELDRNAIIVRTSRIGIATNVLLAAFKAAVGLVSNSIAIVLDAVNNLSDALSSVITIIGTKLAGKKPDKKHPFGHGRIEYLTALIIAGIVMFAGVTSLNESIRKIIDPETASYDTVALLILSVAIVVKIVLGRYVKKTGEKVNSGSLIASGSDALFDAIISASVLASAIIFITTGLSLEAYVGVFISAFIIKASIDMFRDTLGEILGSRADRDLVKAIKETMCEEEEVLGAYDLTLHSYGPDRYVGSAHIEIYDTMTASEIDSLERRLADKVYKEHGVIMTGIGIYTVNTGSDLAAKMRWDVTKIVMTHEGVLQTHGFYLDEENKIINLDIIIDFDVDDRRALFEHITEELKEAYPDYEFRLTLDLDL